MRDKLDIRVIIILAGLLGVCLMFSCNNEPEGNSDVIPKVEETSSPEEAALPHGRKLSTDQSLSAEDKRKLKEAKGIDVDSIGIDDFVALLNEADTSSHLVFFWTLGCEECPKQMEQIGAFASKAENRSLNLVWMNLDSKEKAGSVTAKFRESGLSGKAFRLLEEDQSRLPEIDPAWKGNVPAYYFASGGAEGILYDRPLEQDELFVLAQPFTI